MSNNGKDPEEKKEPKIVDTVTVMEIRICKFDNGAENSRVIAREDLMVDRKLFLIKLLNQAVDTVLRAERRKKAIIPGTQAIINRLKRGKTRGAFGG